ncbi:hypothetical protein BD410DRAFT_779724 [Rickenella mellea]|uniref:Crinkler effector protein N-terminal domain-containing protein n=1 Tax=Rickenella mellea TaxID=50990 RepID=A0A4R5XGM5_9AGAM|nr:hypothetical protein BD410DRAFT_779724 [Rickenella mellea]
MSDTLILYCWILGGKAPDRAFPVPIDKKGDVGMLKRAIKQEKPVGLAYIDADALDLWHCSEPIAADGNLEQKARDLGLTRKDPLSLGKRLSEIFSAPPIQGNLHIVVRAPNADSTTRRHSVTESGNPLPKRTRLNREDELPRWLLELHKVLWDKPQMRGAIFREAELKLSDYLELERLLDAELPSRDNPPNTGFDVKDLKRNFLNSISQPTSIAERRPDEDEASDGMDEDTKVSDGMEANEDEAVQDPDDGTNISYSEDSAKHVDLESLFPCRVRYLDLTALGMKFSCPRLPSLTFIREEYTIISKVLGSQGRHLEDSAVVTGQPGIGKTIYLYLRLIDRLLAGKQTYFQALDGNIYFLSDTVTSVKGHGDIFHEGGNIEALVDGDLDVSQPRPLFSSFSEIRIILTSPPREYKERSWLNQLGPGVGSTYIMNLWSPQEFFVAGAFFYRRDIHINRLISATKHFGLNPRRSWYASTSAYHMYCAKEDALSMVKEMPVRMSLSALLHNATRGPNFEISHTVFELQAPDEGRLFSSARQNPVSEWVMDLVLTEYEADQADATRLFYEYTKRYNTTAGLSAIIWERQVHRSAESPGGPRFPIVLS